MKIPVKPDSPSTMNGHLKILYAAGPGDLVDTHRLSKEGKPAPFEMAVGCSEMFLDWCERTGAEAHLISSNPRREVFREGRYVVENRPRSASYWANGLRHHIASIAYGLSIVGTALRERPNVVIVDSGTTHWIVFSLLKLMSIPVIAVLHNTLWPAGFPPKRWWARLLMALDGLFFRRFAAATVCVSPECERQVRLVARVPNGPIFQSRSQFRRGFLDILPPPPPHELRPFRILYVGRIEESKGVFLILSMAEELERQMPGQVTWKIFGHGGASQELARQVEQRKLGNLIEIAGKLSPEKAREAYGWAHATVVPTTSQFNEGLAMTAVEANLSGRPTVLSEVVPAGEVLGAAAIVVPADNVDGFVTAFKKLITEPSYYDAHRRATEAVQEQFYDVSQGLAAVLGRAISTVLPGDEVSSNRVTAS